MKRLLSMALTCVLLLPATGFAEPAGAELESYTGEQLYRRFCASCHGASGIGDGVVAEALQVDVPDLTLLARRNRDRYPAARVSEIIDGRVVLGAHGTRAMPVWGQEFWIECTTRTTIERLVNYLRTLQRPTPGETDR